MATIVRKIVHGSLLTNVVASYYVAPPNTKCRVAKLTCTNTDTTAHTVTIHLVVLAGSPTVANMVTSAHALAPLETWEAFECEGHVLEAGGSLQAFADVGALVNIQGTGIEVF